MPLFSEPAAAGGCGEPRLRRRGPGQRHADQHPHRSAAPAAADRRLGPTPKPRAAHEDHLVSPEHRRSSRRRCSSPACWCRSASPVQRWSSRGTLSWNGFTWTGIGMRVDDLQVGPPKVSGTLVMKNHDDAGRRLRWAGVQDRAITIYGFDGAATASGDVGGWPMRWRAGRDRHRRGAHALRHRSEFVHSPRTYVRPPAASPTCRRWARWLRINGQDFAGALDGELSLVHDPERQHPYDAERHRPGARHQRPPWRCAGCGRPTSPPPTSGTC